MRKIFGFFLKSSSSSHSAKSASSNKKVALVTNYNACPLGVALTARLANNY